MVLVGDGVLLESRQSDMGNVDLYRNDASLTLGSLQVLDRWNNCED